MPRQWPELLSFLLCVLLLLCGAVSSLERKKEAESFFLSDLMTPRYWGRLSIAFVKDSDKALTLKLIGFPTDDNNLDNKFSQTKHSHLYSTSTGIKDQQQKLILVATTCTTS